MRLLLDTHALLWFSLDDPQLPASARSMIVDPGNKALISPASYWELSIKVSTGKYQISSMFFRDLADQIDSGAFVLLPITTAHAEVVASLPFHHRDPFDRMLVAQAMVERVPILSADLALDAYPAARIW